MTLNVIVNNFFISAVEYDTVLYWLESRWREILRCLLHASGWLRRTNFICHSAIYFDIYSQL